MRRLVLAMLAVILLITAGMPVKMQADYTEETGTKVVVNGRTLNLDRELLSVDGMVLVPAVDVFSYLGAEVDWYGKSGTAAIRENGTVISMRIGSTRAVVNGKLVHAEAAPTLIKGKVMVPVKFVAEALKATVAWDSEKHAVTITRKTEGTDPSRALDSQGRQYVVVVDPGHGGDDPGAVSEGVKEKTINLDIALRLKKLLEGEGIRVYMTRTSDVYVGLYERSGLANRLDAHLFLSIHNNAHSDTSIKGSMTLYNPYYKAQTKGDMNSKKFAVIVQNEITSQLGTKDKGIIERPELAVLRTAEVPTVLAEVAYMTNTSELGRLKTSAFRQQAAEALKDSVIKALHEM